MEFKRQLRTHEQIPSNAPVRFGARIGVKAASPHDMRVGHVAVEFSRSSGVAYTSFIHYADLETPVDPEPPAPQRHQTDLFVCAETGALYKRQYDAKAIRYHYVCLNQIKPSLTVITAAIPDNFKRLYREA